MAVRTILGICDRFKCLPADVMNHPAGLLRMLRIESYGLEEVAE